MGFSFVQPNEHSSNAPGRCVLIANMSKVRDRLPWMPQTERNDGVDRVQIGLSSLRFLFTVRHIWPLTA
jgi:hypothetical protein